MRRIGRKSILGRSSLNKSKLKKTTIALTLLFGGIAILVSTRVVGAASTYTCNLDVGHYWSQSCINVGIFSKKGKIRLTGQLNLSYNESLVISAGPQSNNLSIDAKGSRINKSLVNSKKNVPSVIVNGRGKVKMANFNISGGTNHDLPYSTVLESAHGVSIREAAQVTIETSYIHGSGGDGVSVQDQAVGIVTRSFAFGRRWGAVSINNGSRYPKDSNPQTPMLYVASSAVGGGFCSVGGEREESSYEGSAYVFNSTIYSNLRNSYSNYPIYACYFKNPEFKSGSHGFLTHSSGNKNVRR